MANKEQLEILRQGVDVWNRWRKKNPDTEVDLGGARLVNADLRGINLSNANLQQANIQKSQLRRAFFVESNLIEANLSGADLSNANLTSANLSGCNLFEAYLHRSNLHKAQLCEARLTDAILTGAKLSDADLSNCDLRRVNLTGADLNNVNLSGASLVRVVVDNANISNSYVYGVNCWDLKGEFRQQKDLIVTRKGHPVITVDNIKIANFVYLILNNEEIRGVINALTSKSVLILGRFSIPERKNILNALKNRLRELNLLPIVFEFDRPLDKDLTETIKTLAGLSYFVIADVTNPKSSPLELQATVPDYQIPFVPIIQEGESPFAMMVDLQKKYSWVLNTVSYDSEETLMKILKPLIIDPAMQKRQELRIIKAKEPEVISGKEYLVRNNK